MSTFNDVLQLFRTQSFTQKDKGTKFELLMKRWLKADPMYRDLFTQVWMFEDFPSKQDLGGRDTGIDLVAKTFDGDYWAIQCKCYAEKATISEGMVGTFLTCSGRTFKDPDTFESKTFAKRMWISTTKHFTNNAISSLENQTIKVIRVMPSQLQSSPVDWDILLKGEGKASKEPKSLFKHQQEALDEAVKYFASHERGKLIMACGTGKTFTSLRIAEKLTDEKGMVLFIVPSIALMTQSLSSWMSDKVCTMKAICVCSDSDSSRLNENDDPTFNLMDIPLPACTDKDTILRQLNHYDPEKELVVVFSTYQSVDKVQAAMVEYNRSFDLMICDEAHRTTGINFDTGKEDLNSNFVKVHNNDWLPARKRMYMTATPRVYKSSDKINATDKDFEVCSMDSSTYYGETFFNYTFAKAVDAHRLCDYKVLILTLKESYLPPASVKKAENGEYMFNDATKLSGCINALSKKVRGDEGVTFDTDPRPMRRAVAFCTQIRVRRGRAENAIYSTEVASMLPKICKDRKKELADTIAKAEAEGKSTDDIYSPDEIVTVEARHIDGAMDSSEREELMDWLKEDAADPMECRVLSNVRCLSEGVDVPALDAVIFLSGRNSKVDIIQSVGRVMRTFKQGEPDEKKYGYIIIPVVLDEEAKPEEVLKKHDRFSHVWQILDSLRSHDDRLANEVEVAKLNGTRPKHISVVDGGGLGNSFGMNGSDRNTPNSNQAEINRQLALQFGELQDAVYVRVVDKVGDRIYWERWAKKVADYVPAIEDRIKKLLDDEKIKEVFDKFLLHLQQDINNSITDDDAIDMLAQHLITAPIFDALFEDYEFAHNNSVSESMETMINLLNERQAAQETETLQSFYESVRKNLRGIKTLDGKQSVLKDLYEKFFKTAFPRSQKKLGIVYTPIECVDFIVNSVNKLLKQEFGKTLSDEGVHILDPFTGTGTFITRLLQSNLIKPQDLERKYRFEIHCNEIMLLAYYVADVNIEAVYHDITKSKDYVPYDNICLTDTFQMNERKITGTYEFDELLSNNSEIIRKQRETPIQVIIGNPPYEDGNDSANDETQTVHYPHLEERVSNTYIWANNKKDGLNRHTYNSFFLAFRWASDRIIENPNGGIIGFISNGSWIGNNLGFRKTLLKEFSKIYVLNLRGRQIGVRGEESRREGGKIFGQGSRSQIAITFLVRLPDNDESQDAQVYYHDIGDYLDTKRKKEMLVEFGDILGCHCDSIVPSPQGDWINQRMSDDFKTNNIPLEPQKERMDSESFFTFKSVGVSTNRDTWVYNPSRRALENNMSAMIAFFNSQDTDYEKAADHDSKLTVKKFVDKDATKISWSDGLMNRIAASYKEKKSGKKSKKDFRIIYDANSIIETAYRPFCKINLYWQRDVIERPSSADRLFPIEYDDVTGAPKIKKNKVICVSGPHSNSFECLMTDSIAGLDYVSKTQIFPLYTYIEEVITNPTLFQKKGTTLVKRDGITDWILNTMRTRYKDSARKINKEMIFYYVYGILHSPEYREHYANDLVQGLPYIPIVERLEDFLAFYKAGKELSELHIDYENVPPYPNLVVSGTEKGNFRVEKMRYAKIGKIEQKDTIIYNSDITISNIPLEAQEYEINGFSAIYHIMDRYRIKRDIKGTGITHDPNEWCKEHNNPRYILDLLLSVINVSMKTVDIIKRLPKLKFD